MKHLDDGLLRQWVDEARHGFTLSPSDQAHLAGCERCQTRLQDIQVSADFARQTLSTPVPVSDVHLALARLRQRDERLKTKDQRLNVSPLQSVVFSLQSLIFSLQSSVFQLERMFSVTAQNSMRRWIKPVSVVATMVVVVAAFMLTPLGSYAQGFLNLFTPKQFVAVPVTPQQMRTLPDLSDYGEMTKLQDPTTKKAANADEAAAAAGFTLAKPGFLPAGVANKTDYTVMGGAQGKFTFSAAKAQATAAKKGKTLPPMPANIDGATLDIHIPTAVVTAYGDLTGMGADGRVIIRPDRAVSPRSIPRDAGGQPANVVVVAQMKAPTVTSSGVSVAELQKYLLDQPGIDPQLAASLRAITDPGSTLPIPVPVDQINTRPVQVQGVNGLLMGDSTGLGIGVVWLRDGMIYAVGGALKEGEVLQIANSLR